jgi:hypothetical protein
MNRITMLGAIALLVSSGCSANAAAPNTISSDASSAAPAPQPPACKQGSLVDGACTATLALAASPVAIAPARDHHTTFVRETSQGPYLYVLGGTSAWNVMYTDIQRAAIATDGTLGNFEKVADMPEGRAGHSVEIVGDTLYVLGGIWGIGKPRGTSRGILWAKFAPDGSLSAFSKGPDLPKDVMHFTSTVYAGHLYVFGGRTTTGKDGSTTLTASAPIAADGSIGAFRELLPLTPDRSHHATFVVKDTVYLVGGLTGSPTANPPNRTDIVRAKLLPNGELGGFEAAGDLPSGGVSVSSAQTFGDDVYIFGGYVQGSALPYTDTVIRARIGADGNLSAFEPLPAKLAVKRAHVHQTPVWKQFIYSVGVLGNDGNSIGSIDLGRFE